MTRTLFVLAGLWLAAPAAEAGFTIVLDFKPAGSPTTLALTGDRVGAFNVAAYGFSLGQYNAVVNSILTEVRDTYYSIPTVGVDSRSPIPNGKQLDIDFILGTIGQLPSNNALEYYYVQVGVGVSGLFVNSSLGVAVGSAVRNSDGTDGNASIGDVVASIFTEEINTLGGLTPSNALTSGNLGFTTYAIAGTTSHEIAHTLSLSHIAVAGSFQPFGLRPVMGTGAIDLPNNDRLSRRAFSYSGLDAQDGNAPREQVQQLVNAVGLRDTPVVVPVPASILLAGVGGGFFAAARVRRGRVALAA